MTIQKIKVVNDGDKGQGHRRAQFPLSGVGDEETARGFGLKELDSGEVFDVKANGTVAHRLLVPGVGERRRQVRREHARRGVRRRAEEELPPRGERARASCSTRSPAAASTSPTSSPGALPSWYGTGVAAPAGHDGYFVFGTLDKYVKFYVLATIDVDVDWP